MSMGSIYQRQRKLDSENNILRAKLVGLENFCEQLKKQIAMLDKGNQELHALSEKYKTESIFWKAKCETHA